MTQYLASALPVSGLPVRSPSGEPTGGAYGRHSALTILVGLTVIFALTGCQGVPSQPVSTNQTISPVAPAQPEATPTHSAAGAQAKAVKTTIVRVVDGDTIEVQVITDLQPTNDAGTQHIVRLLGIDAPEMNYGKGAPPECGARAATDHLTELLPKGTEVTITHDQAPGVDRTDRYGRSLAYVSTAAIPDVNLAQLKSGYAEAWIPKSAAQPERWNDYLSAAELPKYAKTGAYGAPEHCQSLGRK
ncbi:thermonuclease family protein [Arthrobacter sp. efr-133-TYG-118]|uniref:thermonuclease family protein n=1 Tax=Arthrobacter sp. efr-133-TYG-118 TaxID=3040279 RepID=UPI00254ED50E|nr:thermonuclease family protein [Arthrobacter sp. efr-133-TYG-118]